MAVSFVRFPRMATISSGRTGVASFIDQNQRPVAIHFVRGTGPSQFYGEYTLCEKCMESMEGGEVLIGDDPNQPQM